MCTEPPDPITKKIISRKEATEQGLSRYFTGNPCPNGHISEYRRKNGECIECRRIAGRERSRLRRLNHPEKVAEEKRRDYQKHKANYARLRDKWARENPEKVKARQRRWRQANKEEFNAMVKDWRHRNPSKTKIQKYRRRMLEETASGVFTEEDIRNLLEQQSGLCLGCQCDILDKFTIDHKTPLSRGGTNDPYNIQLLCKPCNSSKGTQTNEEWNAKRTNKESDLSGTCRESGSHG